MRERLFLSLGFHCSAGPLRPNQRQFKASSRSAYIDHKGEDLREQKVQMERKMACLLGEKKKNAPSLSCLSNPVSKHASKVRVLGSGGGGRMGEMG